MKRREVWWVDFEPSKGGEVRKTRPAIIIAADVFARNLNRIQVVPCTSNTERVFPGEALVTLPLGTRKACANLLFTASLMRFKTRIGEISEEEMVKVEDAVRLQLGLD